MKKKLAIGVLAPLVAMALVATATPANAATSTLPGYSCGTSRITTGSSTTGDTSHNVWISASNNEGKWWAGTSVYAVQRFYSTKSSANSIHYTYTDYKYLTIDSCY